MKKIKQLIKNKIDEYFEEYPGYQEFAYSYLFWAKLMLLSIILVPFILWIHIIYYGFIYTFRLN